MRSSRFRAGALAVPVALALIALGSPAVQAQPSASVSLSGDQVEYAVLVAEGAGRSAALAAVTAAGGVVVAENSAVGLLTVKAPENGFVLAASKSPALAGAAHQRSIGSIPRTAPAVPVEVERDAVEKENAASPGTPRTAPKATVQERAPKEVANAARKGSTATLDPLDDQLWGLKMVRSDLARDRQAGDKRVYVGVLDTGIDGTHPDLSANFSAALSRNFTRDMPSYDGIEIDGPCEYRGCVDPANHDDNGHGTHVAGTIAAAANGTGISGVAPNVTLVNVRGGQDSGYFFVQPVVDALTYGADIGLDVINMSFYVDPWLFNCTANAADSPESQLEQRTIIAAMNRALNYAHRKGVSLVGSLGNNHMDLGSPPDDLSSPDFPGGGEYPRPVDNSSCLVLPIEGPHVIGVSSLGPSGNKADYSNYGLEQISVAAPGGYFRDGLGTDWYRTNENLILSAYPRNVALAEGAITDDGEVTPAGVALGVQKASFPDGTTGYYQFLQGTSMASPHAAGVAALIVSQYGKRDRAHRGTLTLAPAKVERVLYGTAAQQQCPVPPLVSYTEVGRPADFDALCEGDEEFNGFYGYGIVDAFSAVTRGARYL